MDERRKVLKRKQQFEMDGFKIEKKKIVSRLIEFFLFIFSLKNESCFRIACEMN